MSQVQSEVAAAKAPDAPRGKEEAAASTEHVVTVGSLHFRRRLLRNKFTRYQRGVKDLVAKLTDRPEGTTDADHAKTSYQLLRVFSLTYNFIHLAKEDDKAVIPADFTDELKQVLNANYGKLVDAFKGPKDDYEKCLPEKIEKSTSDKLIKFVQVKEVDHIVAKYEKELNDLTEQIDARKNEPRPKSTKKPKSPKSSKKAKAAAEASLEDQMTDLLNKINSKSRAIRLSKGDFESYSEAQS